MFSGRMRRQSLVPAQPPMTQVIIQMHRYKKTTKYERMLESKFFFKGMLGFADFFSINTGGFTCTNINSKRPSVTFFANKLKR